MHACRNVPCYMGARKEKYLSIARILDIQAGAGPASMAVFDQQVWSHGKPYVQNKQQQTFKHVGGGRASCAQSAAVSLSLGVSMGLHCIYIYIYVCIKKKYIYIYIYIYLFISG